MQTRMKMTIWMVVLLLVGGALLGACGGGTPSPEPAAPTESAPSGEAAPAIDAAALVQERCVDCHSLSRTTGARYAQEEWQAVVTRMIGHGAVLKAEEEAALVAYLAETYKP